jgi:hypothetical protein
MAIEPLSIAAIIISVIGALSMCISKIHLRHSACCCIVSDCQKENQYMDDDIISMNEIKSNQEKRNKEMEIEKYIESVILNNITETV